MKKNLIMMVVFAVVTVISFGCKKSDNMNYLDYQTYPFEANGTLTYDGTKYSVSVSAQKSGDLEIKVKEPTELCGMTFSIIDGKVSISDGKITEEINDDGYSAENGILLSRNMFSIPSGALSGAETTEKNGIKYSKAIYTLPTGEVIVYTQTGLSSPDMIEAKLNGHEFSFVFVNEQ